MTFTLYFTQAPRAFPALGRVPRRSCDVSGGDGAVLAEPVNGPFDRVALLVGFAVEPGRATAFAILAEPGLDLIGRHCESAAKWILAVSPARDRPSASRSHGLLAVAPPAARFLSFDSAHRASWDAQHGDGQPLGSMSLDGACLAPAVCW